MASGSLSQQRRSIMNEPCLLAVISPVQEGFELIEQCLCASFSLFGVVVAVKENTLLGIDQLGSFGGRLKLRGGK
jgi:hypothetical protein